MVDQDAWIPIAWYVGRGSHGTDSLREELEAENGGVRIPSTVRWLSGAASAKARYNDKTITASSVVSPVVDESTIDRSDEEGCGFRAVAAMPRPTRGEAGCGVWPLQRVGPH